MLSGGMTCIKNLLFVFNLLFAISGILLLSIGAVIQTVYFQYLTFVDSSFFNVPILLIVVGVIVFVIAFFGCCGAAKENHCMILTFSVFLVLVFILELAGGIAGYIKHNELDSIVERRFNQTIHQYNSDTNIQKTFDIVQHELVCCGMNGPEDWEDMGLPIPDTCCQTIMYQPDGTKGTCSLQEANKDGCKSKLLHLLQDKALVLAGVGIGVAIIQLLGVIFACTLARSIRKEYETV